MISHSTSSKEEQAELLQQSYQLSCSLGHDRARWRAQERCCLLFEEMIFRHAQTIPSVRFLEIEDVKQECRLAILETLDRWNLAVADFVTVCCRTARNRVVELARNNRLIHVPKNVRLDEAGWQATVIKVGEPSDAATNLRSEADLTYDAAILKVDIIRALAKLTREERRMLRLHFGLDGSAPRSYQQLGQSEGISKWAVQRAVYTSLLAVRSGLEGYR